MCSTTSGGRLGVSVARDQCRGTDLETVVRDLMDGQYCNTVRVVGFNTAEGWSRDVSEDVARELRQRCVDQLRELPTFLKGFVERQEA